MMLMTFSEVCPLKMGVVCSNQSRVGTVRYGSQLLCDFSGLLATDGALFRVH